MKEELQNKLVEKYPKIFGEVGMSPQESCMAFGIAVGDGWYWLIGQLCKVLQFNTDNNKQPQVVAAQVKEKFGGLRFYISSGTDEQFAAIHFAESMSYGICEICGTTDNVGQTEGWIKTLCEKCKNKGVNKMSEKLEVKEVFERVAIMMHSEVCGTVRNLTDSLENRERSIKIEHPEYYSIEVRLGYDCDNRAQIEIYGRRKETPKEMLKRLDIMKNNAKIEIDEKCQKDIDAFDRLKEKYPDMFVENAEDFVKETERTTGYTGE